MTSKTGRVQCRLRNQTHHPLNNPSRQTKLVTMRNAGNLKWWSGCSLLIALPGLLFAGFNFLFGNAEAGLFGLKFAAALVILYPIAVSSLWRNSSKQEITCRACVRFGIRILSFLYFSRQEQKHGR